MWLAGQHIRAPALEIGLYCSNADLSDHAHILYTGVLEVEEFNKKTQVSENNGSRDICVQNQWFPIDVMLKNNFFGNQNQFTIERLS